MTWGFGVIVVVVYVLRIASPHDDGLNFLLYLGVCMRCRVLVDLRERDGMDGIMEAQTMRRSKEVCVVLSGSMMFAIIIIIICHPFHRSSKSHRVSRSPLRRSLSHRRTYVRWTMVCKYVNRLLMF